MSTGHIFAEQWIDCGKCDFHEPLGERLRQRAKEQARDSGWVRVDGVWLCPRCAFESACVGRG